MDAVRLKHYNKGMSTQNKVSKTALGASLLAFTAFVIYILYINKEVLYTAHDRSEFMVGTPFFDTMMSKPFGLMQYVGAWLTQFMYKPLVGAGVLCAIWALSFVVGIKAFRLRGSAVALMLLPVAFLLTSMVDMGYWIYFLTIRGYWFSQSVGYLAMLLLLWVARCTPRRWHVVWYLAGICLYPVLGWFALLFVVCLALSDRMGWSELLGLILLLFTANMWRALLYSDVKLDTVMMAGLPRFENPSDATPYLSAPFWLLGACSILAVLCSRHCTKWLDHNVARWLVPVTCAGAGMVFTCSMMYQDSNYIDEMRMVRSAEDDDWEEILDIYADVPEPTASMVMLKNVALMNEGGLLNHSFELGNSVSNIYNPDSLHISFLEIASPLAYYNYGLLNEGFRLAFECGEQAGFSPFYLKLLCRCAYANGETPLVERYLAMLHGMPYYREWQPAPVNDKIRELQECYPDELTGVENSYSYIVNSISLWYTADSKVASEQALFFSMLRSDSRRFWKSLRKYVKMHQGEDFPKHAQEAYIMYMDKAPEEKRMMMPVSEDIYERYQEFWTAIEAMLRSGVNQQDIPEKMREVFGDTYWYYNVFGRKIY